MSNANWTAGHTGKGLAFNGADNYVAIKNTTGLDFTLACWIKTRQDFPVADQTYEGTGILWADVGGAGNDFILGATQSGDGINRLSFFTGGGADSTVSGKSKINTGAWVHIAATRNGTTGERRIYVNGVLEASDFSGSGLLHDNPEIHVGGNTLDGRYFNGSTDGVRVYSEVLDA
ncbi:MAG: LamG domain-containing protein, partial [Roseimicrobium sp.]